MIADDFDAEAYLKTVGCPVCAHVGLQLSDEETHVAAPCDQRVDSHVVVCPSLFAKCPRCKFHIDCSRLCG